MPENNEKSSKLLKNFAIATSTLVLIYLIGFMIYWFFPSIFFKFGSSNLQKTENFRTTDSKLALNLESVEIANSPDEIERGLMYRKELCQKCGMLFVMPNNNYQYFWMKNTKIPLDIIFIDQNYKVVNIAENTTPFSTDNVASEGLAKYVLEVNAGLAKQNNLQKADLIDVPKFLDRNKEFIWVQAEL